MRSTPWHPTFPFPAAGFLLLLLLGLFAVASGGTGPSPGGFNRGEADGAEAYSILTFHDYTPPPPPALPPPPAAPAATCAGDLRGVGDLDTQCVVQDSVSLSSGVYISGNGSLVILDGVAVTCERPGCVVSANLSGGILLGHRARVVAGWVSLAAANITLGNDAVVDTTALAGDPPDQTSGVPTGTYGDGGGHGGRGASCYVKKGQAQEDSWGGDTYAWSALKTPNSYGSKGGSTTVEKDYGGGGGGVVWLFAKEIVLNGTVLADGGDGGTKGGGGSGGSIYLKASTMRGGGKISACGGNGLAGGGGGRVSIDVFSRHDDAQIFVHGLSVDQAQGQILLAGATLTFGLTHYPYSEFELLAEELLMSDSTIKVFGALRMSVKMLLMWNSRMTIDGGRESGVATSLLEGSNLIVLKEASVIHSNANLGIHGQGVLNLSGQGDTIEAQRLILSLFYNIVVGSGAVLRGPLINGSSDEMAPKLNCEDESCPMEIFHPPEDCNLNSSLSFTLQICRVEDIDVSGLVQGTVINFNRARSVTVQTSGTISATGLGCRGGIGQGKTLNSGISGGGGHGGKGGDGIYSGEHADGGSAYGHAYLPCELGSGSGNVSASSTAGGGIIVMGSLEQSLPNLSLSGAIEANGGSLTGLASHVTIGGPGGGSGGTILLFVRTLLLKKDSVLSSVGGIGSNGSGGGGGGRIHFHWSDIPTGDDYVPFATVKGTILTRGGVSEGHGFPGENGTVTGKDCPKGLYGTFCKECPSGTYKNITGSSKSLCSPCPPNELPHRAVYISVRGGVAETPCPYKCVSDRYRMPHCFTALEELIYTFGGPWLFGLLLSGLLVLLALVLSIARMKFVGTDELPGPAPTQHSSQIDHSFPFLESLNEVAATPDLMLSYLDFFLGGDEKRTDLPPRLHQRFPMSLIFGGDGSYMAPFSLHSDRVVTSLISQAVPSSIWHRLVAGLNAQLRLVRRGNLDATFLPVLKWLETHANPALNTYRVRVDLAWFQTTALGYCQFGLVLHAVEGAVAAELQGGSVIKTDQQSLNQNTYADSQLGHSRTTDALLCKRITGTILNVENIMMLKDRRDLFYPLSFILHNTKPVGHQDLVGLVISILLLADFSLVLLTFLQLYSYSMVDVLLVLFILPLGILAPFPAGINALFSHGPRRSAGLARVYALWNITSLVNVVVAFVCGFLHYKSSNKKHPSMQPWNFGGDETSWWLFPTGLVLCKCIQARLVDWHVSILEIQDRAVYSNDPTIFWQ
ncbi:hypothetical protein BAE44_0020981 [Dichanthelium oligosanthes]|uniref:DUF8003 domain-containing protein n=1 Tax=Dichanthelium oligosanthes TaxID=888268 RepID=A0A1E5UYS2_9POAL|nr:hypothetical protein BAE44_0020981 [Dichanthelium oligosanthes]